MSESFCGWDDLREWLVSRRFKIEVNQFRSDGNLCNWCAYRCGSAPARPQLVIYPFHLIHLGMPEHKSVELDITGETSGIWFKLEAYSVKFDELRDRLDDIERRLVAAWEALAP